MQIEALLRADEAVIATPAVANPLVTAFFETLRREQNRYLDAVGTAGGQLGPELAHLTRASAIQLRLTRRMFDAQRSIVTHRAEIDAEIAAIRRDLGLPADVFTAGLPDADDREQGLDALLDEWWRLEQLDRSRAFDESGAVRASAWPPPVLPAAVEAPFEAPVEAPADAPVAALLATEPRVTEPLAATMSVPTGEVLLPDDLLAALDAADPAHLDALFTSLAEALTSEVAPSPVVVPYTFDDLIIRLEPSNELTALEALHAPPSTWERMGVPALEQLQWIITRVLLPISIVTGSLALAMAWVG